MKLCAKCGKEKIVFAVNLNRGKQIGLCPRCIAKWQLILFKFSAQFWKKFPELSYEVIISNEYQKELHKQDILFFEQMEKFLGHKIDFGKRNAKLYAEYQALKNEKVQFD